MTFEYDETSKSGRAQASAIRPPFTLCSPSNETSAPGLVSIVAGAVVHPENIIAAKTTTPT
jgi:hypothetical protein